jgi:DNA polymerase/3'-5' exonuclease PolX
MSDKPRYPRKDAIAVAKQMCDALRPVTEKLCVAGSLRRGRNTVCDVEIIYVPCFEKRQVDLLSTRDVNLVDLALEALIESRVIAKRTNAKSRTMWGEHNKFAIHACGIPVDFFASSEACWFNYLVWKTGGASTNRAIAEAAQNRGWKWNPYGEGFTDNLGEIRKVKSEQEVFEFVGLRYLEPWERG